MCDLFREFDAIEAFFGAVRAHTSESSYQM